TSYGSVSLSAPACPLPLSGPGCPPRAAPPAAARGGRGCAARRTATSAPPTPRRSGSPPFGSPPPPPPPLPHPSRSPALRAVVAVGAGAAPVGDRVAQGNHRRAIGHDVEARDDIPVIGRHRIGKLGRRRPLTGLKIRRGPRAGMPRHLRGRGPDVDGEGKVA